MLGLVTVSGIDDSSGLDQQNGTLGLGNGTMFHTPWDDQHVTFPEFHGLVTELHVKHAFDDEKHLIGIGMGMPVEAAGEFGEFDVLTIHIRKDSW